MREIIWTPITVFHDWMELKMPHQIVDNAHLRRVLRKFTIEEAKQLHAIAIAYKILGPECYEGYRSSLMLAVTERIYVPDEQK